MASFDLSVKRETFKSISDYFNTPDLGLIWPAVFVIPAWVETWWKSFGQDYHPGLLSVKEKGRLIGLALLKHKDNVASFMGSADICDYLDFVLAQGKEKVFFSALLDHLVSERISCLDLRCLRPESNALGFLLPLARERGYSIDLSPDGVSFEVELPQTWEEYLMLLKSKQRHEVKRKFRRLHDSGEVVFRVHDDAFRKTDEVDLFFSLFRQSRPDKDEFLTPEMEYFFRNMMSAMSRIDTLKMGELLIDNIIVAIVLYFDFQDTFYLYNNGYNSELRPLSIGLLCKVFAIEKGILEKKRVFDFLKGMEIYKSRLGGREIPLSRCRISFT